MDGHTPLNSYYDLLSEKSAIFFSIYTRVLITHLSKHHEVGFHSDIVFLGRV